MGLLAILCVCMALTEAAFARPDSERGEWFETYSSDSSPLYLPSQVAASKLASSGQWQDVYGPHIKKASVANDESAGSKKESLLDKVRHDLSGFASGFTKLLPSFQSRSSKGDEDIYASSAAASGDKQATSYTLYGGQANSAFANHQSTPGSFHYYNPAVQAQVFETPAVDFNSPPYVPPTASSAASSSASVPFDIIHEFEPVTSKPPLHIKIQQDFGKLMTGINGMFKPLIPRLPGMDTDSIKEPFKHVDSNYLDNKDYKSPAFMDKIRQDLFFWLPSSNKPKPKRELPAAVAVSGAAGARPSVPFQLVANSDSGEKVLFRIIPVESDDKSAPPLYQIVPTSGSPEAEPSYVPLISADEPQRPLTAFNIVQQADSATALRSPAANQDFHSLGQPASDPFSRVKVDINKANNFYSKHSSRRGRQRQLDLMSEADQVKAGSSAEALTDQVVSYLPSPNLSPESQEAELDDDHIHTFTFVTVSDDVQVSDADQDQAKQNEAGSIAPTKDTDEASP